MLFQTAFIGLYLYILVGELFFHSFASLLRFYGQCRSRTCQQAFEADGFAGIGTETVIAFVNTAESRLHFIEKFTLAIAGAQL